MQVSIMNKVLAVCRSDPEAFPRRAAVNLIISWHLDSSMLTNVEDELYGIMSVAIYDVDWEVKKKAVEFWRSSLDRILSNHESMACWCVVLERFCSLGGAEALLSAADDCDQAVGSIALKTLVCLRRRVCSNRCCECESVNRNKSSFINDSSNDIVGKVRRFLGTLEQTDFESRYESLTLGTDWYADNPELLLDDIIKPVKRSLATTGFTDDIEDDAAIIDCY